MKRDTIWTKSFILVMILNFLCGVVGMMTLPLVLEYAKEIGAGLTLASDSGKSDVICVTGNLSFCGIYFRSI